MEPSCVLLFRFEMVVFNNNIKIEWCPSAEVIGWLVAIPENYKGVLLHS